MDIWIAGLIKRFAWFRLHGEVGIQTIDLSFLLEKLSSDRPLTEAKLPLRIDLINLADLDDILQTLHNRHLHYLIHIRPSILIDLQQHHYQLFETRMYILLERIFSQRPNDPVLQLCVFFAESKGSLPMYHLVYNNTQCPNICFFSINIEQKSLRRHVVRRPDIQILKPFPIYNKKAYL